MHLQHPRHVVWLQRGIAVGLYMRALQKYSRRLMPRWLDRLPDAVAEKAAAKNRISGGPLSQGR